MKFSTGVLNNNCQATEFCENWPYDIHTSLEEENEFMLVISLFLGGFW
jgi:hypothetical protein